MKRALVLARLLAGCMSYVPQESDTKTARVEGFVTRVDTAKMIIYLAPPEGEMRDMPLIRYNSLTILDRSNGVDRMENLQPGEAVLIMGRQDGDGDIVAERVAVQTGRLPK